LLSLVGDQLTIAVTILKYMSYRFVYICTGEDEICSLSDYVRCHADSLNGGE